MRRLQTCLLLAALAASPPLRAADDAPRETLQALQNRIREISAAMSRDSAAHARAEDQLRASETAISEADAKLRALETRRRAAAADLARLTQETAALDARLAQRRSVLATLLVRDYRAGSGSHLSQLLSGNDPNQLARDHYYLKALSQAQARMLADLRADIEKHRALAEQALAQRGALNQLAAQQTAAREQLESERGTRRELVAKLGKDLAAQRNEIAALRQDEARMQKLAEELARLPRPPAAETKTGPAPASPPAAAPRAAAGSGFAALQGQLTPPLRGDLLRRYGSPRGDGGAVWKGIVIGGSRADVHAVAAGRVVFADWLRGFGNLMIIDHGDTYLSIYGHNEALFKQVGDNVVAQDVIARTGGGDGAVESGLYFELRHQGQTLDPLKWVRLR
ncbi:MAG: peptidoglycan DD-metalloendopeptidase family protein [Rhodocyclaceae bacterium]|nr:peptidoglycan DD-metalloendopeptidase family protein [Rhodocyclaceae bacterium]MBX3668985.1 peptidoglycan DD-metalloendopeptidase family protein [Rhodocyclaceae bacterium]